MTADLYKRHASKRHRGISYRERADGSRAYAVFFQGRYVPAGSTEREALAVQSDLRSKKARGERVTVRPKVRFPEVAEEWYEHAKGDLRAGWAKEMRRALDGKILPEWENWYVAAIGPADCIELARKLSAQGLKPATVANYLKPARAVLEFAVLKGFVSVNPFSQVPRGKLPSCGVQREHREWTTEDVQKLIRAGYALDERKEAGTDFYGLAIELALRTGVRLGELCGLRYGDLDHAAGVWNLRQALAKDGQLSAPKTAKSVRRIPLAPELLRKIAARKLRRGASDEDFVFAVRKAARPISGSNFRRRAWNKAVENAGLTDGPKVTPHDARHAFASEMAELGLTSSDVAEVLGHTTAGITERIYTHAFNREAREKRVREAMSAAMTGGAS